MHSIEQLEKLLKTEVLVQVNEEIKTIKKLIEKQKNNEDLKIELNYILDVKKYYDEVITHIEKKILKEEDAVKITLDNGIVIWKTKWDILQEPKKDIELDFLCEIQNYLKAKNIILEINEVQDLEKIFLKYHKSAK